MVAAILTTSSPANAHVLYQSGKPYQTNDNCVGSRAEVSHGVNNAGYYKADTTSWNAISWAQCFATNYRPGGYIAVGQDFYRWSGAAWQVCGSQYWSYNQSSAYKVVTYHNAGRLTCLPGWYYTSAASWVNFGSGWQGGGITSGPTPHWIPA